MFDNLSYDSGYYTPLIHIVGGGTVTNTPNAANYFYGTVVSFQCDTIARLDFHRLVWECQWNGQPTERDDDNEPDDHCQLCHHHQQQPHP